VVGPSRPSITPNLEEAAGGAFLQSLQDTVVGCFSWVVRRSRDEARCGWSERLAVAVQWARPVSDAGKRRKRTET
jgi:hypothetical protein